MPNTKDGKGIKPEKLWPFDWEQKAKPKPTKMSQARLDYITKRSKLLRDGK